MKNAPKIRKVKGTDEEALRVVLTAVTETSLHDVSEREPWRTAEHAPTFVAIVDQVVVAFVSVAEGWAISVPAQFGIGPDSTEIVHLFTHPDHQGHGCGTHLLRKAIAWWKTRESAETGKLYLRPDAENAGAIRLYKREGFEEVGRFNHGGVETSYMVFGRRNLESS